MSNKPGFPSDDDDDDRELRDDFDDEFDDDFEEELEDEYGLANDEELTPEVLAEEELDVAVIASELDDFDEPETEEIAPYVHTPEAAVEPLAEEDEEEEDFKDAE